MVLPAPNLDDRRFQDLVDDAKRMVMRRCPEWTDHNVSDPGVTLIETFAFMTDQILFRLNRVPDRLYVKFLELIGIRLLPATPARVPVTFWLSAPAAAPLVVSAGTEAATLRTETEDSIVFASIKDLTVVPCSVHRVATLAAGAQDVNDRTDQLTVRTPFPAFGEVPAVDDALLIGLTDPVPHCAVRLDLECRIDGVGVDPTDPPLVWEAWTGSQWTACECSNDETGGLNKDGAVVLHVPDNHQAHVIDGERAGWLRARVVEAEEGQPTYSSSPIVHAVSASTVGGTIEAIHAEIVQDEEIGVSEGVPGQRFHVLRAPVLAGAGAPVLEVSTDDGWERWKAVEHFAESGPEDQHFILDAAVGEVSFGPVLRLPDGTLRQYGAVPPKDAVIRMHRYAIGGGHAGNIAKGALQTLKSSIPFVGQVENLHAAHGGVDGETLDQAKARGPVMLRTRSRAVTAEDYESITKDAAPELARVRCLTAGVEGVDAGTVKILVVPAAAQEDGRIEFEDLVPAQPTLDRIAARLDKVRLVGARVVVEPPLYRGVTVVARLVARPRVNVDRVQADALSALFAYVNPLTGGPDGTGWPFGRPVQSGDLYAVLQRVRGVELVEDVRLFGANPVTGQRGEETTRLALDPNSLVFSYEHHVRVEEH